MTVQAAKRLRRTMTPHEVKLWVRLRELRGQGLHFRRQVPVERFTRVRPHSSYRFHVYGSENYFEKTARRRRVSAEMR